VSGILAEKIAVHFSEEIAFIKPCRISVPRPAVCHHRHPRLGLSEQRWIWSWS